jgi:hypothetical protein
MAQNFPSNPTIGNSYTVNNESWTYDGSGWTRATTATANAILPAQTGNTGKYLTTDGTSASWGTVAAAVPKITSISVTDNSYTVLDDTAVSTAGGYIKITGTGFTAGSQVLIGTVAASSVSWISSTELRAQVPATTAGTYVVYVVATDGAVAIRVNGITFSATPTWSTGSSLGSSGAAISIQLAAVSDTTITYSLAAGSTLPTGLTLSSSGLLSGTVTGVTVETVYNFTINAVDLENQDSPRTFSITITVKDTYFPYVPLLLETGSTSSLNTTVTDSSASPNTVTRVSNPSTGWVSPYQTDGYWGNQFNGSTDYLTTPNSSAFGIGTGDFTLEAWIYLTAINTNNCVFAGGSTGVPVFSVNSAPSISMNPFGTAPVNGTLGCEQSFTFNQRTWYHVAFVKSSLTIKIFVNGSQVGSNVNDPYNYPQGPMGIGGLQSAGNYFPGYVSNLRFVKGVAVYTGNFTPPTSPLQRTQAGNGSTIQAITGSQTSLLTCQSNRFIDNGIANSGQPFTITVNGAPQVNPYYYPSGFTAPTASPGAVLLNGTTQYISSPAATGGPFDILTGNFTLEMWIYPTSFNSVQSTIIGTRGPLNSNWELRINPSASPANALQFYFTTVGVVASSAAPQLNTWSHVAITRSSNLFTMYVNGISVGTSTFGNGVGATSTLWIGTETPSATTDAFPGYIGNLRIVKGTAVYSGTSTTTPNFTPPSGPLTQIGGTYPSLTNVVTGFTAANTSLLLALSDSNFTSATNAVQNNTFIDTGPYALPITRNGTPTQGSVTPYWPLGQWSNYFAGSQSINAPASSSFQFAGDFTIECWVFKTDTGESSLYVQNSGSNYFALNIAPGTGFNIYLSSPSPNFSATDRVPAINVWNHVALVRSGAGSNNVKIYLNGVASATTATNISTLGYNLAAYVGALGTQSAGSTVGYISNFRIASSAVYTSNFTPPTTPLGAISGGQNPPTGTQTKLLTCQSNRFLDNSPVPFTITPNGTPTVQAFQPFSPTASYTTALYGGSGYFNSSTDYLSVTDNAALKFGSGNFTIEGWVYLFSVSGNTAMYARNGYGFLIGQLGANFYLYASSNGGSWDLANGVAFGAAVANTWFHFAVVRNGANITLYLNGVLGNTVAVSTNSLYELSDMTIGRWARGDGVVFGMNGHISNLRLVKGTAVYTGAFTPPTAPLSTTGPASAASYSSTTNINTTFLTPASLLLNMANAGIYDAAVQNDVITAGDAQVSTTQYKWSPTSMKFDGTGDWLTLPVNSADTLGSGNWTIEGWFYFSSVSGNLEIFSKESLSSDGIRCVLVSSKVNLSLSSNGTAYATTVVGGTTIATGTWYYLAFTRSANTITIYLNGTSDGTGTFTGALYETNTFWSLASRGGAGTPFNGYIQDFRVTKGVARTVTTVPTLAFQTK